MCLSNDACYTLNVECSDDTDDGECSDSTGNPDDLGWEISLCASSSAEYYGAIGAPFNFCPSVDCYAPMPVPAPTVNTAGMDCTPGSSTCGRLECVCAARRLRNLLFGHFVGVCTCQ